MTGWVKLQTLISDLPHQSLDCNAKQPQSTALGVSYDVRVQSEDVPVSSSFLRVVCIPVCALSRSLSYHGGHQENCESNAIQIAEKNCATTREITKHSPEIRTFKILSLSGDSAVDRLPPFRHCPLLVQPLLLRPLVGVPTAP